MKISNLTNQKIKENDPFLQYWNFKDTPNYKANQELNDMLWERKWLASHQEK